MRLNTLLAALVTLCLISAAPAWAQRGMGDGPKGGGGGGKGGGLPGGKKGEDEKPPNWAPFEGAAEKARGEDKYILLYVFPLGEVREPSALRTQECVDASNGNWVFTKKPFDKEDAALKRLKVTGAPTIIGLDKHSNPFPRATAVTTDAVRSILKATPELVERFRRELAADWKKAVDATDDARAVRLFGEIATCGRRGYDEIENSFKKLDELGDRRFEQIDEQAAPDAAAALKALEKMAVEFRDTPPGAEAELRLARSERERDQLPAAVARVHRVRAIDDEHFKEQVSAARKLLDEIVAEGLEKIERALKVASAGEADAARAALRKIQADYKGTDVARRAAEALKTLE